ncbi:HK97 gp10 family phage protein [Cytobacillus oceanisediminis]|uniref:HK97 gp10 family phage protein n=1 Tax=Cytobacillus oceanisediminis TaxID=665099 RepID=UPI002041F1EB|nr:HK97 gp10 family phage protein [Cytobacillus oceanisediminis]MCM3241327.1 HK97 gp10 family phage protein [Cytobacillus oceanisediminis]
MTNVTQLSNEITRLLRTYANGVQEGINVEAEEVGKEIVSELKTDPTPKLTGDYRKGWRVTKQGKRKVRVIVHNKDEYRLTHLLENGHALKNGGRAPAYPHIRPAEQRGIDKFLQGVERVIEQG